MLYVHIILSMLNGGRNVDVLMSLTALTMVAIMRKYRERLNHPWLSRYAYVATALFYAIAIFEGDKYTIALTTIVWIYNLIDLRSKDIRLLLRELISIVVIIEIVGLSYQVLLQIGQESMIDRFFMGIDIDVVLFLFVIVWMMGHKMEKLLIRMMDSRGFRYVMHCLVCAALVIWGYLMVDKVQCIYWAQLLQEHHRKAILLIFMVSLIKNF